MDGQVLTHADLVKIAGRWLRNTAGCSVVLEELCAATGNCEDPDAIGWYTGRTMLVECKASRSDFVADRKKPFRADPSRGLGMYRYFLAPKGLLRPEEMPDRWGLLEVSGRRVFRTKGHEPGQGYWRNEDPWCFTPRFNDGEVQMLLSAMSRIKVMGRGQRFPFDAARAADAPRDRPAVKRIIHGRMGRGETMSQQPADHHRSREPGWPNWGRQNLTLTTALRIVRMYGDRLPSVAQLRADFGVSRATAFRWRAAFRDAVEQHEAAHAG